MDDEVGLAMVQATCLTMLAIAYTITRVSSWPAQHRQRVPAVQESGEPARGESILPAVKNDANRSLLLRYVPFQTVQRIECRQLFPGRHDNGVKESFAYASCSAHQ